MSDRNDSGLTDGLTPAQRLEQSRRALLETMRPGASAAMHAVQQNADAIALESRSPEPPTPVSARVPSFVAAAASESTLPDPATVETALAAETLQAESAPPVTDRPRSRRSAGRKLNFAALGDGDTARALSAGAMAAQRLVNAWWRRHPLHLVADISEPLIEKYARRHPYRLLAMAAAVGAAVVVLKPWRWNGTRRWARSSVNRELQSLNISRLSQMVVDSLLHNGRR